MAYFDPDETPRWGVEVRFEIQSYDHLVLGSEQYSKYGCDISRDLLGKPSKMRIRKPFAGMKTPRVSSLVHWKVTAVANDPAQVASPCSCSPAAT